MVAAAVVLSAGVSLAQAASSLNLGSYKVTGTYALDIEPSGSVSGLEASAVTYARDRGTLFYVGDEGTGVVEVSLTGQTLGSMAFNWTGTDSKNHDTEGLTYLGNGQLVVTEERLFDAYSFAYSAGGTANLAANSVSISNAKVGNSGLEGISYDARNGGFVAVQEGNSDVTKPQPQDVLAGKLTFSAGTVGTTGTSTMANLFNPASLGVSSLSDVQTLSSVDSFAGTAAADHLLVLSLGSRTLLEVNRAGQVISSLDLSGVLANNGIEGVTVDEKGTIYLVAEQWQKNVPAGMTNPQSQLIVLTAPVPEPETFAMLLAGLGVLGAVARRRKQKRG